MFSFVHHELFFQLSFLNLVFWTTAECQLEMEQGQKQGSYIFPWKQFEAHPREYASLSIIQQFCCFMTSSEHLVSLTTFSSFPLLFFTPPCPDFPDFLLISCEIWCLTKQVWFFFCYPLESLGNFSSFFLLIIIPRISLTKIVT